MIADPNEPSGEQTLGIHAPRDVPIAFDDAERLRRLLERSLGTGFKLAIIEAATPLKRQAIWGWVCEQVAVLGGRSVEFDLSRLAEPRRFNFWYTLIEHLDPQAQPDRKMVLGIWGVEEVIYEEEDCAGARWLEQLNVQRDLFVRDLPFLWILFIHPRTRHVLKNTAPDFCDFASLWAEVAAPDTRPVTASFALPFSFSSADAAMLDTRSESVDVRMSPTPAAEPVAGAARQYTLRILHISDLHEGQPGQETLWRRRRVLSEAWLKNLEVIAGSQRAVDLVCFTGDVAFAGRREEYVRAADFVRELLRRLGLGPERFFAVPGNHDVDRDVHTKAWRTLRDQIEPRDAEGLSAWLAGGKPPRGVPAKAREQVLGRSEGFRHWLFDLGRDELLPETSPHGRFGYRRTLRLPDVPFPVQVIGLDTAWLAGDDADPTRLWLTDDQVLKLTTDEQAGPLSGFRLGLWHHPLDQLADGPHARRLLTERLDLGLRGHLHEAELTVWADPERTLREFAAGCLYESTARQTSARSSTRRSTKTAGPCIMSCGSEAGRRAGTGSTTTACTGTRWGAGSRFSCAPLRWKKSPLCRWARSSWAASLSLTRSRPRFCR
ncbi:MAG: metallophosphoesterase family protein [Burkholderiales bacterium]